MIGWAKFLEWCMRLGVAISEAITSRTKPEEVQVSEHKIKIPRMTTKERLKVETIIFRQIKNNPEADIPAEVRYCTDLNPLDEADLITNLTKRLSDYRRDFPHISGWRRFKKGK
jgi:hypothetical protein